MELFVFFGVITLAAAVMLIVAIVFAGRVSMLGRRVTRLERELDALRARQSASHGAPPEPAPHAGPPAHTPFASPPPLAAPRPHAAPPHAPARPAAPPVDLGRLEQLVGGVWLQNLGAMLLLVGVFLMILWGYTTGRFGPQVLVGAGVMLGLAFAWRGDRVARRLPAFGHALIGTGLGIVYLTLYLGCVRLHVLAPPLALGLLALVSFASIAAALRYRVQLIGALGVIGAFLPQFLAGWLGLGGFHLSPWLLLGYLATVDVLVFALAARAGWSALDLAALALSALSWIATFHAVQWGWGEQIALAALFTALGLAPIPRLVRVEGRVRAIDLAVVALAPVALIAASAPFLGWARREEVAMLLLALAVVPFAAAWCTDRRRPERDLWAPLTGAATLFVTAALERALGPAWTPLAWCAEGALLLVLGLAPNAGWLRFWGALVLLVGECCAFAQMAMAPWQPGMAPGVHPDGLRALAALALLLVVSGTLARHRARLTVRDLYTPEIWGALGNFMLVVWCGIEAGHVASALVEPVPGAHRMPPPVGVPLADRRDALAAAVRSAAWWVHAGVLAWLATARASRGFLRGCAYVVGATGLLGMWLWLGVDGWWLDQAPVLNATALLRLFAAVAAFAIAARLGARREHLAPFDEHASEVWAAAAGVTLALWSMSEAGHVARALVGAGPLGDEALAPEAAARLHTLTAALVSGAWLAEAIGLLLAGWLLGSAFLRWCALVLLGVTLVKFVGFDLQSVDVFWRFLTAIVVGAAMLAMSYAYQRRARGRSAAE